MAGYPPEEVVEQILHCLPPKAIVKCTLVSKSWMSLIKSSDFIHAHLRHTVRTSHRTGHHLRLLRSVDVEHNHRAFFSLHFESPDFCEYTQLETPFRFITNNEYCKGKTNPRIDVVATCNGLVCLADYLCLIWNPSIRKYVVLPRTTATQKKDLTRVMKSFGFGYDSRNRDYKVLRILSDGFREFEVYSLARGSWKRIGDVPKDFMPHYYSKNLEYRHVSVDNALHWLVLRRQKNKDNAIVCFDLEGETFTEMVVPDSLRRELCYISKYREWLALIRCKIIGQEPTSSGFFMWVMNDYGVAESWTMLFSVRLIGFAYEPLSLTTNGELVLKRDFGDEPVWVDLNKNYAKAFGTKGYKYYFLDCFVESIVLLGQCDAISY
ncbi:F-box protein At4g22390-like [Argentina anserina]|uniref:F-box protein At4g22390-like n=1 Tax=Argentina anserina TaxID=57926 RepID=UPI002176484F|nr:F-box protein At4g22390-like [Potentilla anserina]